MLHEVRRIGGKVIDAVAVSAFLMIWLLVWPVYLLSRRRGA